MFTSRVLPPASRMPGRAEEVPSSPDAELEGLLRTQDGVLRLREWMGAPLRRLLHERQAVDEASARVLERLVAATSDEDHPPIDRNLRGWVAAVAEHVALDLLRERTRHRRVEVLTEAADQEDLAIQSSDPEERLGATEQYATLLRAAYRDPRYVTVALGRQRGESSEQIGRRLGITRNHAYQLWYRLRVALARCKYPSMDPERVGHAIGRIASTDGPLAHSLAHVVIRRLVGARNEDETEEHVALVAEPPLKESDDCPISGVAEQTVAAALALDGVRLAEVFWFLDDANRLPQCEALARYVYYRIAMPFAALMVQSASPRLMDFVLRGRREDHATLDADRLRRLLLHLNLIDIAVRIDRRLMARGAALYMATWHRDRVHYLDLHDPAWIREYFLSLIDGCRRIPIEMEAERWLAISAFGRHLASSRLGHEDLETIVAEREKDRTITRLATAFCQNDATGDWDQAKRVFLNGWNGGLVYKMIVMKAPLSAPADNTRGMARGLLPLAMECLESDSAVAAIAGIHQLFDAQAVLRRR